MRHGCGDVSEFERDIPALHGPTGFADGAVLGHYVGMAPNLNAASGPATTRMDDSPKTAALMAWLDPDRGNTRLDGVDQGVMRVGADVVRGTCLPPPVAAAVAHEVDLWLAVGRMGSLELPPEVPSDVARLVYRRAALIRPASMRPAPVRPIPEASSLGSAGQLTKSSGDTPPQAVRDACRRGLELAPDYGGPGLTEGAKARARAMAAGNAVGPDQAARMVAWFARHDANYTRQTSPPSPGYVAFLLWGGDAGRAWARGVAGGVDDEARKAHGVRAVHTGKFSALRVTHKATDEKPKWERQGYVGPGGAWATAKREAKKRGKNEAYARKLYGNYIGRSLP